MKKYVPLVVVGVFVLCGMHANAFLCDVSNASIETWDSAPPRVTHTTGEVLDQSQTHNGTFGPIGVFPLLPGVNITIAQSFIPQKEMLTRIQIEIGKNTTTTYPFVLAIREALDAENLGVSVVSADDILTENFSWVSFSFKNMKLITGQTYWMVAYTANITDNFYGWTANSTNPYPNGSVAVSLNDGHTWQNETTVDMTFMTFGMDASELSLELQGGFGVKYSIENVGSVDATGIQFSCTITGGIFNRVNITHDGVSAVPLPPDETFKGNMMPIGLGPITVTITAWAANALEVTKTEKGVVLFIITMIK